MRIIQVDTHPVIVALMGNEGCIWGPLIFLLYHYYRVGGGSS